MPPVWWWILPQCRCIVQHRGAPRNLHPGTLPWDLLARLSRDGRYLGALAALKRSPDHSLAGILPARWGDLLNLDDAQSQGGPVGGHDGPASVGHRLRNSAIEWTSVGGDPWTIDRATFEGGQESRPGRSPRRGRWMKTRGGAGVSDVARGGVVGGWSAIDLATRRFEAIDRRA